jgi:mRNA interferase HicA
MKYEQLHKMIRKAGWVLVRTSRSHRIYSKNGRTYPVPFHGGKEVGKGLASKVIKEMGL